MGIETAATIVGGNIVGGLLGANAAQDAADTQYAGTQAGIAEQRRQYDTTRADLAPYRTQGYAALDKLSSLINSYQPFDGQELQNDPGYKFGLDQGRAAMDQSAAARGRLFSDKTLRDLVQFGNDYGSTKFNERGAFRLGEQNQRYNQLAGVAGTGQNAINAGGQFGAQSAGSIADLLGQGANARAAGTIGSANAWGNAIGNAGNAYLQTSMLDRVMGGRSGSRGGVPFASLPNADPNWGMGSAPSWTGL